MMTYNRILSNADLLKNAPSIFGTPNENTTSDRYVHIPTIEIVDALRDSGFNPVMASQTQVKSLDNKMSTKHLIRFRDRNFGLNVNDEIPEIVMTNSHDGSAVYNLMLGIFRLICANGMIVASGTLAEIKVKHIGIDVRAEIIKASTSLIGDAPKVFDRINGWKQIVLNREEQIAFARAVIAVKGTSLDVNPESVIKARRYQDNGGSDRDLWRTFNVVQENIIKGGSRGYTQTGKRQSLRGIKSVSENVRMNKAMWQLAEEMERLKQA